MRRGALLAAYALVAVVAVLRVASTHRVFSETLDEPAHVAAGLEWLTDGRYRTDDSHPPLERVLSAVPAWLNGIRFPTDEKVLVQQGNRIFYAHDRYERNVSQARLANLLFLLTLIAATAALARRVFPEPVPLIGTAMLTLVPPLLGHAGVATTDLAVTAMLPVALLAFDRWLEQATPGRAATLGLALGFGILSKFSFLLFFPVGAIVLIALRRKRIAPLSLLLAAVVAFFVVWAGYRFSFGRVTEMPGGEMYFVEPAPRVLWPPLRWIARNVPLPAPELPVGAGIVALHDRGGHLSYLLGRYSEKGWWYYFPVILFFKTPLPFLLLALWGSAVVLRDKSRHPMSLQFVLIPLLTLLAAMSSSINIGIRHILPLYPWLAVAAGVAVVSIWSRSTDVFGRVSLGALLLWLVANGALAHPDYLAWFNEAAGGRPERIAADSNLDWGQDVLRLRQAVRRQHIDDLKILLATNAWVFAHGIHVSQQIEPYMKVTGWVAVSETAMVFGNRNGEFRWLDPYRPVVRVGKTIRLYYIPE